MPKDAETKPDQIKQDILKLNPKLKIRDSTEEPIAFGLVALIADFVTDDVAGAMEEIEKSIRLSELVGEFDVIGTSRISATVRK
ncbi:MAG: elongation factor 1-beta [Nitrososphaerota archaeon]|nr:elongation factor 1-beta [Nitrososphaerota archaeon]